MNILEFKQFNIKSGTYRKIKFKSEIKPLAAHKNDLIEKVSTGVFRIGLNYNNIKSVKESETENFETKNRILPYGQYLIKNKIIEYKDELYLRLYTTNNKNHKCDIKYYYNGRETSLKWLVDNKIVSSTLLNKEHNPLILFNIKLKNLIDIY